MAIKSNEQWQAESDAETMAMYQEIMQDKSRRNRAIKAAKTRAADFSKKATMMQNVAQTKVPARTAAKSVSRGTAKTISKRK